MCFPMGMDCLIHQKLLELETLMLFLPMGMDCLIHQKLLKTAYPVSLLALHNTLINNIDLLFREVILNHPSRMGKFNAWL